VAQGALQLLVKRQPARLVELPHGLRQCCHPLTPADLV
jgi:hypothetical protein